jgi:hypothetical protein
MTRTLMLTAALLLGALQAADARGFSFDDDARIRANTPACNAYPEYRWIGRVSGNTQDNLNDGSWPVSFVGCFPSFEICERWKGRAGAIIDSTIIQYSCRPR